MNQENLEKGIDSSANPTILLMWGEGNKGNANRRNEMDRMMSEAAYNIACAAVENWCSEGNKPETITKDYVRNVAEGMMSDVRKQFDIDRFSAEGKQQIAYIISKAIQYAIK